jgi:RNA polymerase sigma-70 factor (ECF subfamily)
MFMDTPKLEGLKLHRSSETALVRAVIAGDKTAYGILYDRYAPLVRAICHDHTGNLADAQDLTQDVFLRAYERLDRLRQPDRFGGWLVGIARHRCREWRRQVLREQRRHSVVDANPLIVDRLSNMRDGQLLRLIGTLDEKERLALHAFYLQERSAEVARRIMGLSRSGFYKLLERARTNLRRQLERDLEKIE